MLLLCCYYVVVIALLDSGNRLIGALLGGAVDQIGGGAVTELGLQVCTDCHAELSGDAPDFLASPSRADDGRYGGVCPKKGIVCPKKGVSVSQKGSVCLKRECLSQKGGRKNLR